MREVVSRRKLVLGIQHYKAADLQAVQAAGEMLQIRVLGLATIADDVTPKLALATIESLTSRQFPSMTACRRHRRTHPSARGA